MTGRAAVAGSPRRLPAIHSSFPSRLRRALWGIRTTGIRCEPARPVRVPGRHITTKWRVLMGLCGAADPEGASLCDGVKLSDCLRAVPQPNIHNCEYQDLAALSALRPRLPRGTYRLGDRRPGRAGRRERMRWLAVLDPADEGFDGRKGDIWPVKEDRGTCAGQAQEAGGVSGKPTSQILGNRKRADWAIFAR